MITKRPNLSQPSGPPKRVEQVPTKVVFEDVTESTYGHRVILYGPGGIGKSTLACLAPGPVAFFDVDESLGKLRAQLLTNNIPLPKCVKVTSWSDLRAKLKAPGWDEVKSMVFDTWAPIEPMLNTYVLKTVKNDKDRLVPVETGIEGYGYGKGYKHVYDAFLPFLGDLDFHIRAGRNVIIICHDDASKVPNPAGQDYIRWEPKMQHTPAASIRYRTKDWSDHTLFLGYDIDVENAIGDRKGEKVGRAVGHGSRTLHCSELPHFMAKSRTTQNDITIELGQSPWGDILG